jgi:multidrug resistance efflux pump
LDLFCNKFRHKNKKLMPSNDIKTQESVHYRESLATMKTLHTPSYYRVLAYWLLAIFSTIFIGLFFPWQQNIRASGLLTAFYPKDRPQMVPSVIAGKIADWKIREGQHVSVGDTLVVISEVKDAYFDPELLDRTREMIEAKKRNIQAKEDKIQAYKDQIAALRRSMDLKLSQAQNKLLQAQAKLASDSADLQAAFVDYNLFKRQLMGADTMFVAGAFPLRRYEEAKMKFQSATAKYISAQNKINIARNELSISITELDGIKADMFSKIYKAESELNATESEYYESVESLAKLQNQFSNYRIRNDQYILRSPQNGFVVQTFKAGIGEMVKEGDPLLSIMPDSIRMAVELYVRPMDVPLLDSGRHVRLQFDGWPAFQFSGWPSVAVGTFGGRVEVIDRVIDESGKFRILVVQENRVKRDGTIDTHDTWPKELRLGSAVLGWVLLDDVPIYFEIWRQLNGFPPSIDKDFGDEKGDKGKSSALKEMKPQKKQSIKL